MAAALQPEMALAKRKTSWTRNLPKSTMTRRTRNRLDRQEGVHARPRLHIAPYFSLNNWNLDNSKFQSIFVEYHGRTGQIRRRRRGRNEGVECGDGEALLLRGPRGRTHRRRWRPKGRFPQGRNEMASRPQSRR